jgi:alkenylglycerophosphocholine/alkenylglycerophosphoethanolamine hydrolase
MILLLTWLAIQTGLRGVFLWFGLGLLFSLAGDIFLMLPPRFFMAGLASFSLTHLAYFLGFIKPHAQVSPWLVWGLVLFQLLLAFLLMSRITRSQVSRGLRKLTGPTLFYALLINLMLFSALLSLFRPDWSLVPALLVSLGALFFYISDLLNAWIRFVNPLRSGRVAVMVTYHLGQFLLIIAVVLHFKPL